MKASKYELYIGIDTGVNTGFAMWNSFDKKFITIETLKIHEVILALDYYNNSPTIFFVRIEDARLRKWYGNNKNNLQGVGSVKRDAKILEDVCIDLKIPYEMVAPSKGMTKWDAAYFKKVTGWTERTSNHSRDAACLVYGK